MGRVASAYAEEVGITVGGVSTSCPVPAVDGGTMCSVTLRRGGVEKVFPVEYLSGTDPNDVGEVLEYLVTRGYLILIHDRLTWISRFCSGLPEDDALSYHQLWKSLGGDLGQLVSDPPGQSSGLAETERLYNSLVVAGP